MQDPIQNPIPQSYAKIPCRNSYLALPTSHLVFKLITQFAFTLDAFHAVPPYTTNIDCSRNIRNEINWGLRNGYDDDDDDDDDDDGNEITMQTPRYWS